MEKINVLKIDAEDLEDILLQLEKSFGIKFNYDEILNLISIEELAELVISRLNYNEGNECSSQIVFYKLRQLLIMNTTFNKESLSIHTELKDLFPSEGRRKQWKTIFSESDLKVPDLRAHSTVILTIFIVIISFLFILFTKWYSYTITIFLISIFSSHLLFKFGKCLPCKTLGELSKLIVREDYINSRKKVKTVNIREVKEIILSYFTDWVEESGKVRLMNTKIDYL